jgi:outer membrane scaffolding protein for murein synthesis (MipA/OmpV family)
MNEKEYKSKKLAISKQPLIKKEKEKKYLTEKKKATNQDNMQLDDIHWTKKWEISHQNPLYKRQRLDPNIPRARN